MDTQTHEDFRDLASLLAEAIRRQGAQYGPPDEWRRDFTTAVRICERHHRAVVMAQQLHQKEG